MIVCPHCIVERARSGRLSSTYLFYRNMTDLGDGF